MSWAARAASDWWNGLLTTSSSDDSEADEPPPPVFDRRLPEALPVVDETVDALADLACQQRLFVCDHCDQLRVLITRSSVAAYDGGGGAGAGAGAGTPNGSGEWTLNGFRISGTQAVDLVRASPDVLSNLQYKRDSEAGLWTHVARWFRFDNAGGAAPGPDDLAFAISVAEAVEVAGHVLHATSRVMAATSPEPGSTTGRDVVVELASGAHRGDHSVYFLLDVDATTEMAADGREQTTLNVATSLYLHTQGLLGTAAGVPVRANAEADVDADADADAGAPLRARLSKNGTFVASGGSHFVLDPAEELSSATAAHIMSEATQGLLDAANRSLRRPLVEASDAFAAERADARREAAERERERVAERAERVAAGGS